MKTVLLVLLAISLPLFANAQKTWTSKDSSAVDKLKRNVLLAETKLKAAQIKVDLADSLVQVGSSQVSEGKTTQKQLKAETKNMDKQHSAERKSFVKLSGSKNRDEAKEAKIELKKIDTQYKTEAKDLANKVKANDKLITTGQRNLDKGKTYTKTYGKTLKENQSAFNNAQDALDYKLDELNQVDEPEKEKKKKK